MTPRRGRVQRAPLAPKLQMSGDGVRQMADEVLLELYDDADATAEETEGLTQGLRSELLGLEEVAEVSRGTAGPPPPGTRGLDVAALGALVVAVEPTIGAISRIVSVVRDWLAHRGGDQTGQTVRITVKGQSIELGAATAAQQQELVDEFLHAVGAPGSA